MMKKLVYYGISFMIFIGLTGCATNDKNAVDPDQETVETINQSTVQASEKTMIEKKVDIINTKGKKVGMAVFTQQEKGVLLQIYAKGLEPGRHGFHIHETGKCEPPNFKTAGGHFNPTSKEHGFNNPAGYHAGDMANLVVGKNGIAEGEFHLDTVSLIKGEANSLLDEDGSALVIHSGPDDYTTDPAGNSGDRVGCAVIAE